MNKNPVSLSFQIFESLGHCSIKLLDENEIEDLKKEIESSNYNYRIDNNTIVKS